MKGDFLWADSVGSVPGMLNKEVLAQLYINLHNELKNYLPRKSS